MNTKNYSTPTKKYKTLISSIHSVYRLVNSTYELKDLISRLTRLICQIFDAQYSLILLLDPSKKYSLLKCMVSDTKRVFVDKKIRINGRLEKRIIKKLACIRERNLLGAPLISEDVIGLIIVKRTKNNHYFDSFDLEVMMTLLEQAVVNLVDRSSVPCWVETLVSPT